MSAAKNAAAILRMLLPEEEIENNGKDKAYQQGSSQREKERHISFVYQYVERKALYACLFYHQHDKTGDNQEQSGADKQPTE